MATTITAEGYGDINVWPVVRTTATFGLPGALFEVWAASASYQGATYTGFGGTAQAAMVSALEDVEYARQTSAEEPEGLEPNVWVDEIAGWKSTPPPPGHMFKFVESPPPATQPVWQEGDIIPRWGDRGLNEQEAMSLNSRPVTDVSQYVRDLLDWVKDNYGVKPPEPVKPEPKDLTADFWAFLNTGQKIRAIKELRDLTGLSLKSSKQVVDELSKPKGPAKPMTFSAGRSPVGTVIRIADHPDARYAGFVFEKVDASDWVTPGGTTRQSDTRISAAANNFGYDLLYLPDAT